MPPSIAEYQTLIRSCDLAELLGVHLTTLIRWTHKDKRFRDCLFRRGFYSVQHLRDAGILVRNPYEAHAP